MYTSWGALWYWSRWIKARLPMIRVILYVQLPSVTDSSDRKYLIDMKQLMSYRFKTWWFLYDLEHSDIYKRRSIKIIAPYEAMSRKELNPNIFVNNLLHDKIILSIWYIFRAIVPWTTRYNIKQSISIIKS